MLDWLITLLLIIFPLGQLTRISVWPEVNLYWHDFIIVFLIGFCIFDWQRKKREYHWPRLTKPIIGFASVSLFSLLLAVGQRSAREILISSLYLVRWGGYASLYFIIKNHAKKDKIVNLLLGAGISAAVLGLFQYAFYPDIRPLTIFHWDPHYYRVAGTYLDPGFSGMIFALTLFMLINKAWSRGRKLKFTRGKLIMAVIVYSALSLTYARSCYLAYLAGIGVISWKKKAKSFFINVLLIGIATILVLPRPGGEGVKLERQSTIWARVENWKQSLKIASVNPLLGRGFNTYRYVQREHGFLDEDSWQESHSASGGDSSLLFVLGTTGVTGLLSFIELLKQMTKNSSLLIKASGAALLVHSFFNNSLFYGWIMIWWWIVLAGAEAKGYKKL